MFERVLVPLDGSAGAERAIPLAARLVRATGGSIIFVRVVLPPAEVGKYAKSPSVIWEREAVETHRAEATSYLTHTMLNYAADLVGINTEQEVVTGLPSPTIFTEASLQHVDLIVMCSHRESGLQRWVFGSVAQEAIRYSSVPVLILNEHAAGLPQLHAAHPLRVLVALDGSPLAEAALEPAAQLVSLLAAPAQGAMHLLRVVDLPPSEGKTRSQAHIDALMREQARQEAESYLRKVANHLHKGTAPASKLTVTTSVIVSPDVVGTVIKQAEQPEDGEQGGGCDLIALASHGHGGLQRLLMGSVPEGIFASTQLPLLIVRPQETATQSDSS
jgi:nucleotide-binding universal stress UspA family protein